jgi:hypothetical protein
LRAALGDAIQQAIVLRYHARESRRFAANVRAQLVAVRDQVARARGISTQDRTAMSALLPVIAARAR